MLRRLLLSILIFSSLSFSGACAGDHGVAVDSLGVIRWIGTSKEVLLFGVNYTVPFAYDIGRINVLACQ